MAATKALGGGNWEVAYEHLAAIPVWGLMPQHQQVKDHWDVFRVLMPSTLGQRHSSFLG